MGWGATRARRFAELQIRDEYPDEVICGSCGEPSKLEVVDNSKGEGHYRYDIVTKCCESISWFNPGEGEDGESNSY